MGCARGLECLVMKLSWLSLVAGLFRLCRPFLPVGQINKTGLIIPQLLFRLSYLSWPHLL